MGMRNNLLFCNQNYMIISQYTEILLILNDGLIAVRTILLAKLILLV